MAEALGNRLAFRAEPDQSVERFRTNPLAHIGREHLIEEVTF